MLTITLLVDGKYRVVVDFRTESGSGIHAEWIFEESESDADEDHTILSVTFPR